MGFFSHPGLCLALMVKKKHILNGRAHTVLHLRYLRFCFCVFLLYYCYYGRRFTCAAEDPND